MASRICPDCETPTDDMLCPKCGHRTLRERRIGDIRDPLLGTVLDGRYRIESSIGRGGMGTVYRGVQLATGQVVAIKVIRAESAADMESAKRFHREARAASLLTHPHTIRVFDFGESENGDLYMVLEFLAGKTLGKFLRGDERLSEVRVAKVFCEIAQSLSEAHAAGLAHRDLKPDNVMLVDAFGDPDFVKVLDFGIAKFLSGSSGESSVTRTGAVVGTPHYMSPEQASGSRQLSPAVDVYALGVMLFEALSGRKPYDSDSPLNILMAHVREPIPDLPASIKVSIEMRRLIRRMLDKDAARRPTAPQVAGELERLRMLLMVGQVASSVDPASGMDPMVTQPMGSRLPEGTPRQVVLEPGPEGREARGQGPRGTPIGVPVLPIAKPPLHEEVSEAQRNSSIQPTESVILPRRRRWWPVLAVLALLAGAAVVWASIGTTPPEVPAPSALPATTPLDPDVRVLPPDPGPAGPGANLAGDSGAAPTAVPDVPAGISPAPSPSPANPPGTPVPSSPGGVEPRPKVFPVRKVEKPSSPEVRPAVRPPSPVEKPPPPKKGYEIVD